MAAMADDEILKIVENGDVIFIVGAENQKILVLSSIVKNASKPLRDLICEVEKQDDDLILDLEREPSEIFLPNVGFNAMSTVLRVIHAQVPPEEDVSPGQLLEIALLVNKYGLQRPLSFALRLWLIKKQTEEHGLWSLFPLAVVALLVKDDKSFRLFSSALLVTVSPPRGHIDASMPALPCVALELAHAIEVTKNVIRGEIIATLTTDVSQAINNVPFHRKPEFCVHLQNYLSELSSDIVLDPSLLHEQALLYVRSRLLAVSSRHPPPGAYNVRELPEWFHEIVLHQYRVAAEDLNAIEGFCRQCFLKGKYSFREGDCQCEDGVAE